MKKILVLMFTIFIILGCSNKPKNFYGTYVRIDDNSYSFNIDSEKILAHCGNNVIYETENYIVSYITKTSMDIIYMDPNSKYYPIYKLFFYKIGNNIFVKAFDANSLLSIYYIKIPNIKEKK